MTEPPNKILAIDPGTKKAGIAIVDKSGNPLFTKIIKNENSFQIQLREIITEHNPDIIIIGNGTYSKIFIETINSITDENIPVELIDETNSSVQARNAYLNEKPLLNRILTILSYALGLSRIEIDDRVAIILAKKFINSQNQ